MKKSELKRIIKEEIQKIEETEKNPKGKNLSDLMKPQDLIDKVEKAAPNSDWLVGADFENNLSFEESVKKLIEEVIDDTLSKVDLEFNNEEAEELVRQMEAVFEDYDVMEELLDYIWDEITTEDTHEVWRKEWRY